jgi:hypothetical protein
MAHLAISRISLRHVILGSVVLGLMAGNTVGLGVKNGSFVAIRALDNGGVTSGEGKTRCGMVKSGRFPGSGGVAGFTQNRYACGSVIRILRRCKISGMACVAGSRSAG